MVSNLTNAEGTPAASPCGPLHASVSGEGVPVLLLHGLFGMGSNLGGLARFLASGFQTHQVDLPNHGRSPWADTMGLAEMGDAIAAYAADLDSPLVVVGHSLGGKVAMQMAIDHPERVAALVVADIAPIPYPSSHDHVFAAITDVSAREPKSRGEAGTIMSHWVKDPGVAQFLSLSLRRDSDAIYRWRFNAEGLKANYSAVREPPTGNPYHGPALFIYGENSTYVDRDAIAASRALFPGAVFESIADTGHWLHVEKPDQFNGAVKRFISDVVEGSL